MFNWPLLHKTEQLQSSFLIVSLLTFISCASEDSKESEPKSSSESAGIPTSSTSGSSTSSGTSGASEGIDTDGDGIIDSEDSDIDGDGISNDQDSDIDGDSHANENDSFPSDNTKHLPEVSISAVSPSTGNYSSSFRFEVTVSGEATVNITSGDIATLATGSVSCDSPSVSDGSTNSPSVFYGNCYGVGTLSLTIDAGVATKGAAASLESPTGDSASITNAPMISQWAVLSGESISLPLRQDDGNGYSFVYDFEVDWGDQTTDTITAWNQAELTHNYVDAGNYTITLSGIAESFYLNDAGDKEKLISVSQLGEMRWKNLSGAFHGAANLETLDAGKVDTSMVVDMSYLITGASKLTAINLTGINTSAVLNLEYLFFNNERLTNLDLSMFDTSNVTNMSWMFWNADSFNQPIGDWDTFNVINMSYMLGATNNFNQPIGNWNTENVTNMSAMFYNATSFDQDISSWDVTNAGNPGMLFDIGTPSSWTDSEKPNFSN